MNPFPIEAVKGHSHAARRAAQEAAANVRITRSGASRSKQNAHIAALTKYTSPKYGPPDFSEACFARVFTCTIDTARSPKKHLTKKLIPSNDGDLSVEWMARGRVMFIRYLATIRELRIILKWLRRVVGTSTCFISDVSHGRDGYVKSPHYIYRFHYELAAYILHAVESEFKQRSERIQLWIARSLEPAFHAPHLLGPVRRAATDIYWTHIAPCLVEPELAKAAIRVKRPRDEEDEEKSPPAKLQRRS